MLIVERSGVVTEEEYKVLLLEFLKDKLFDKNIQYYINNSPLRAQEYKRIIESWTTMNDENKFLMSMTDKELEEYVNSISQNGVALTENSLLGTWIQSTVKGDTTEFVFNKDHTFSYLRNCFDFIQ